MVCTLIDHRNDVNMFKPTASGFTEKLEHFDVISMVDKSIDNGKLLSTCFLQ